SRSTRRPRTSARSVGITLCNSLMGDHSQRASGVGAPLDYRQYTMDRLLSISKGAVTSGSGGRARLWDLRAHSHAGRAFDTPDRDHRGRTMPTPTARKLKPFVNLASFLTVAVTFALFIAAAITKGLTEELLLEAAVFLISVKLVLGNYK